MCLALVDVVLLFSTAAPLTVLTILNASTHDVVVPVKTLICVLSPLYHEIFYLSFHLFVVEQSLKASRSQYVLKNENKHSYITTITANNCVFFRTLRVIKRSKNTFVELTLGTEYMNSLERYVYAVNNKSHVLKCYTYLKLQDYLTIFTIY